eukprot:1143875-Pelagomonas_calceolata.AAC.10
MDFAHDIPPAFQAQPCCTAYRMEIPNLPADGGSYYFFVPHPSWRFIVLDSYDVSVPGVVYVYVHFTLFQQ